MVYFQGADIEPPIRAAGLEFHQLGREDFPPGAIRELDEELGKLKGLAALRCAIRRATQSATMILRDAPAAIRDEGVDGLNRAADLIGAAFGPGSRAVPSGVGQPAPERV